MGLSLYLTSSRKSRLISISCLALFGNSVKIVAHNLQVRYTSQ